MNKKNMGFSLVELIVVIAIMAVLVGVLAPAYLKYVEKSRKSSDVSSVSDIVFAAEKIAVDVQFSVPESSTFDLKILDGEVTLSVDTGDDAESEKVLKEWVSIAGGDEDAADLDAEIVYTCKSSEFKGADEAHIVGTVGSDGSVKYTYSGDTDLVDYSKDFKDKLGE